MVAAVLTISTALSGMNEILALACQIAVGIATYSVSIWLLALARRLSRPSIAGGKAA